MLNIFIYSQKKQINGFHGFGGGLFIDSVQKNEKNNN